MAQLLIDATAVAMLAATAWLFPLAWAVAAVLWAIDMWDEHWGE